MTGLAPLRPLIWICVFLLASCGADGLPQAPGMTGQGDAQIGVAGS